jgi:autotransporter-associated beta strand protein
LIGNTQSLLGNVVNNGNLIFNQSNAGTFAGNISGSGSFTKLGQENLTLSGTNSYTGGTTISTGKLIGDYNSLSSQIGNIVNNASLEYFSADSGFNPVTRQGIINELSLNMSGNGSFTKIGPGVLYLSGRNSYVGGTTISDGYLVATADSLTGNVLNNASLVFNQSNVGIFSGNISGTGSVINYGPGNLNLTGTNNYNGGTFIYAGTLTGNAQSLRGNILNDAALTFDQSGTGQFAGDISGVGSVTKLGDGNLTLSGINTYTGGTTISTGTLTGNTESLTGSIINNASLVFNQTTNDGIYAGLITGTGSLIKQGNRSLTLTNSNSYKGSTTISAGTLIGDSNSLSSEIGNIVNNASLVYFSADSYRVFNTATGQDIIIADNELS